MQTQTHEIITVATPDIIAQPQEGGVMPVEYSRLPMPAVVSATSLAEHTLQSEARVSNGNTGGDSFELGDGSSGMPTVEMDGGNAEHSNPAYTSAAHMQAAYRLSGPIIGLANKK